MGRDLLLFLPSLTRTFRACGLVGRNAKASLCEIAGAIDLAAALGAVDAQASSDILSLASRVRAMTIALMR